MSRAAELGYTHLALTDHDDLGGAVRFSRACQSAGIAPLLGAETTLWDGSHLTLIVENWSGWKNICALLTAARTTSPRGAPALDLETLSARSEGLVALSGCPHGRLPTLLRQERHEEAREWAGQLRDIFGDRFHLELWDHRTHQEASLCADLLDVARETGIPWTVTHDVHYADASGRAVHDLMTCIRRETTLDEAHRRGWLRPSAEWCLQAPAEMARRWSSRARGHPPHPRDRGALRRLSTHRGAPHPPPLSPAARSGNPRTPCWSRFPAPGCASGCRRRRKSTGGSWSTSWPSSAGWTWPTTSSWCGTSAASRATSRILCQGRGSAANSLVCYALRVTAVDPVANDLLFERFLSPERPEPPDIDVDFAAMDDRERVLQYVYDTYGRGHAAMVCTHVEYRGRSAIRDAVRVLGLPVADGGLPGQAGGWILVREDGGGVAGDVGGQGAAGRGAGPGGAQGARRW